MSKKNKSKNKSTETKKEAKARKPIPKTIDSEGNLAKLSWQDFPSSRPGRISYCEYKLEVWKAKLANAKRLPSQKDKLETRLEKLRAKMAELETQLAENKE